MAKSAKQPSSKKVLGAKGSETRAQLIKAAEELMRTQGYGAVTARGIAKQAGLKHQVIFYYFDTLDDLLVEVFRAGADKGLAVVEKALESDTPFTTYWEIVRAPRGMRFMTEFMALASRNKRIRDEIARYARRSREIQTKGFTRYLKARGIEPGNSPATAAVLMTALGRLFIAEGSLGFPLGHSETAALFDAFIQELERTGDTAEGAKALFRSARASPPDSLFQDV